IGISFPDAASDPPRLGERLRVHGSDDALKRLAALDWLKGMRDHVRIDGPSAVPAPRGFRVVSRVQAHSSAERMRRRLMKRHDIDHERARQQIPDSAAKQLDLPYLDIRSQSTGQRFRLFVRQGPIRETAEAGVFSSYGLSDRATVPWF
ncbi:MAG: type I-F CRISPR-associated endoribonuclease Cas6/Csy4, partial [Burkholderiaceae bacterium]